VYVKFPRLCEGWATPVGRVTPCRYMLVYDPDNCVRVVKFHTTQLRWGPQLSHDIRVKRRGSGRREDGLIPVSSYRARAGSNVTTNMKTKVKVMCANVVAGGEAEAVLRQLPRRARRPRVHHLPPSLGSAHAHTCTCAIARTTSKVSQQKEKNSS
jgi:hypothetical protein